MEDVWNLRYRPGRLEDKIMLHAKCAKFLACYTPGSNLMNFPEQGNVWTTFCVLNDIANVKSLAKMRDIGAPPNIL